MKIIMLLFAVLGFATLSSAASNIPFADGQVTQLVSANQNGRAVTYRAMVVRVGGEPEHNLKLVIQKLQDPKGNGSSNLLGQLILSPDKLPNGKNAQYQSLALSYDDNGEFFEFSFNSGKCRFNFDGSSVGTDIAEKYFSCKGN